MDTTNKLSSFLTEDIAYFLGLVIGRGTIVKRGEINKLVINFPFKNIKAVSPKHENKVFDIQVYLANSLDVLVARLKKLGLDVEKHNDEDNRSVCLTILWKNYDITWQLLNYLLNEENSDYHSFRIPKAIFQTDKEKQKEFVRGYFDVTGHARESNKAYGQSDQQRIYLEVDHRNWFLVLDICKLLEKIGIPVQSIDFGHPNFRDPKAKKNPGFWAKEHQVKIYANQFRPIGSYLTHKLEVLEDLASMNKYDLGDNTTRQARYREKEINPEEKSEKLPHFLQGKHFNHYSELLESLEKEDSIKAYE